MTTLYKGIASARVLGLYGSKTLGITCELSSLSHEIKLTDSMKDLYRDENGKTLIHFIVSIPMKYCVLDTGMLVCARLIASAFDTTQVVYGIHGDKEHMHTHFMVNTVTMYGDKITIAHIRAYVSSVCKEVFSNQIAIDTLLGQN